MPARSVVGVTLRGRDRTQGAFRSATRASTRLESSLRTLRFATVGFVGAFGSATGLAAYVDVVDRLTLSTSRLRLVTDSQRQLADVQRDLLGIAQETRTEYEAVVLGYARAARASDEYGISQERLLRIQRGVAQSFIISGALGRESTAAQIQFSQGLASNRLSGDELRSVLEQAPRLAQAIAQGLDIGIGRLREIAKQGQLTTETVLGALESQLELINDEFQTVTRTTGQAATQLGNSFQQLTRNIDQATGVGGAFRRAIDFIRGSVDALNESLRLSTALDRARAEPGTLFDETFTTQEAVARVAELERQLARPPGPGGIAQQGRRLTDAPLIAELELLRRELRFVQAEGVAASGVQLPADYVERNAEAQARGIQQSGQIRLSELMAERLLERNRLEALALENQEAQRQALIRLSERVAAQALERQATNQRVRDTFVLGPSVLNAVDRLQAVERGSALRDRRNRLLQSVRGSGVGALGRLDEFETEAERLAEIYRDRLAAGIQGGIISGLRAGREGLLGFFRFNIESAVSGAIASALSGFASRQTGFFGQALSALFTGSITGRQSGGQFPRGAALLTGEAGPELLFPRSPGTVLSNRDSQALLLGLQRPAVTVPVTIIGDVSRQTRREVSRMVPELATATALYWQENNIRGFA